LLGTDGSTEAIARAVASAAENSLAKAASDRGFRYSFWLLTQLPLAARSPDFAARLQQLGIDAGPAPTLLSLTAAFQDAVDRHASTAKSKTDFREMARLAATESLTSVLLPALPGLFDTTSDDLRYALGKLAVPGRFAKFSRQFFARLVNRNLEYFLSRVTANHIGPERRFRSLGEHAEFREALAQHCFEAALIVEAFSGEWYSKTNWLGGVTPAKAAGFSYVAFEKLREELRRRTADG
jgi:hypothetical protein